MNHRLNRTKDAQATCVSPKIRLGSPSGCIRFGFTMMETLLSMSLISLLIAAILASTTLYVQYRSRSMQGNREAVVLRGTLQDLQKDLRACVPGLVVWPAARPTNEEPNGATDNDNSIGERVLQDGRNDRHTPIHFIGRADALLLLRAGDNPRFIERQDSDREHFTSESQVLWMASFRSEISLPISHDGGRVVIKRFRVNDSTPGLRRTKLSPHDHFKPSWDINSELVAARFRYFDGTDWLPLWDRHLRSETLPVAVEMSVAFRDNPSDVFRIVTQLPCGEPTD